MGHITGQDIFARLGGKIDRLEMRAAFNGVFREILTELYTPEEAELVVRMPYGLQTLGRIARVTGYREAELARSLERLCRKGLVMDLFIRDEYYYMISPLVVGIFEFTMMRRGGDVDFKKMSRLFSRYLLTEDGLLSLNYGGGQQVGRMRALPHEEAIARTDHVRVLDYEKAAAIIDQNDTFSLGYCSCRHEKLHLGEKKCDTSLEVCASFGMAATHLVRNNLARGVTRSEMLDNLAQSKELGLVMLADNTKQGTAFICNCCGCCCNSLASMRKFDYSHLVVSSTCVPAFSDGADGADGACVGCGLCAKTCPVDAIEMVPLQNPDGGKKKRPQLHEPTCLGCGVCALKCKKGAIELVKRRERVLHPETSFERVILQCIERGTLQYQIFDDPGSATHRFMQAFVGAFLNLPAAKKVILSDMFRSSFLKLMEKGAQVKGRGFLMKL